MTGALFAQTVVFGWLANPQSSLEGLVQVAAAVGVTIRAQSLDERFTAGAAVFLEELLSAAVQTVVAADAADPVAIPLLERFSAVALLDSSTITVPSSLALWWPGGSHGTAALKLHLRYDLCRGQLSGPLLCDGRTSDRSRPMLTDADRCRPMQTDPLPPERCASVIWASSRSACSPP